MINRLASILRETPELENRQMILEQFVAEYREKTKDVTSSEILDVKEHEGLWVGDRVFYMRQDIPGGGYVAHFLKLLDSTKVFGDEDHKQLEGRTYVGVWPDQGDEFIDFLPEQCTRMVNGLALITLKQQQTLTAAGAITPLSDPLIIRTRHDAHISELLEAIQAEQIERHSAANVYTMGKSREGVNHVHTPVTLFYVADLDRNK
jgi:hypothetical protein